MVLDEFVNDSLKISVIKISEDLFGLSVSTPWPPLLTASPSRVVVLIFPRDPLWDCKLVPRAHFEDYFNLRFLHGAQRRVSPFSKLGPLEQSSRCNHTKKFRVSSHYLVKSWLSTNFITIKDRRVRALRENSALELIFDGGWHPNRNVSSKIYHGGARALSLF